MPNRRTRRSRGGKAIGSGGYGCVFRPALRCGEGTTSEPYDPSFVSKLMTVSDAREEAEEIERVMPILMRVPDRENYFAGMPGAHICSPPAPLTDQDKERFEICAGLGQEGITADTVNDELGRLALITQPYGGIDLESAWFSASKKAGSATQAVYTSGFRVINDALRRLLTKGIVPMNDLGLLQGDVKAPNVLVDMGEGEGATADNIEGALADMTATRAHSMGGDVRARLIDWGLAIKFDPEGPATVPKAVQDRALMFNAPVSMILFINDMSMRMEMIMTGMKQSGVAPVGHGTLARVVARKIHRAYLDGGWDQGHHDYLGSLIRNVYGTSGDCIVHSVIIEYLAAVLQRYMDNKGRFRRADYFKEVFAKNMDVYGFIMCYASLIITGPNQLFNTSLSNGIARIIGEYCLSPRYAASPIPVDELAADLGRLNEGGRVASTARPVRAVSSRRSRPSTRRQAEPERVDEDTRFRPAASRKNQVSQRRSRPTSRRSRATASRRASSAPFSWPSRKRCPKGSRRNKRDGKCYPKS